MAATARGASACCITGATSLWDAWRRDTRVAFRGVFGDSDLESVNACTWLCCSQSRSHSVCKVRIV